MPLLLVCNASRAGGTRSRVHVTAHHLTRGAAAAGLSNNPRHSSHPRCAPWSCFTRGPPTLVPRLPRQVAACTAHAVATPRSRSLAGPPPQRFGAPPRPSGRPPAPALFRGWLIVASRPVVGHVRLPDAKMLPSNYSTGQHSGDGDDMASWLNHGPRIAPGRPLSRDRTPGRTM